MIRRDSIIAGAGFVLLTLWAVIFVNILISTPPNQGSDWRKRLQPHEKSTENVGMDDNHVLVLATTLMAPDVVYFIVYLRNQDEFGPTAQLQRNTMYFLSTMPGVLGVVYTDDIYWFNECKKFNLECHFEFP